MSGAVKTVFPLRGQSINELLKISLIVSPNLRIVPHGSRHFEVMGKFGKDQFRFNPGVDHAEGIRQKVAEVFDYHGPGLMININQEGGKFTQLTLPGMTHFPGNMAIGAASSPSLSREVGEAQGRELRQLGITWNLAPVAEITKWPGSRGIGTRSFGKDPQLVARLTAEYIAGLQNEGVAATAKHFPYLSAPIGDYHLCYPFVTSEVRDDDLLPFKAAIDAKVAAIMIAHSVFTSIDPKNIATFSKKLVGGLLRDKLGYDGVIVTDSLSMRCLQGIEQKIGIGEMAVQAFEAGADMVLIEPDMHKTTSDPLQEKRVQLAAAESQIRVLNAFILALRSGRINREQIERSVGRIVKMSDEFGLKEKPDLSVAVPDNNVAHQRLACEVAGKAISTIDQGRILPLKLEQGEKLALVLPELAQTGRADNSPSSEADLEMIIRERHQNLVVLRQDDPEKLDLKRFENARFILIRTYYGYLKESEFSLQKKILEKLSLLGIPIILIASGSPLDAEYLKASAYVMCYSVTEASYRAAVEVLFDKVKASREVPPFLDAIPHKPEQKVTIAIPSTGEEPLFATLDLMEQECELLESKGFTAEIIIGLNNLSGENEKNFRSRFGPGTNRRVKVRYLPDATGKFDAMRLIAADIDPANLLIFADDDIALTRGSLLNMAEELSQKKDPYLLGATPLPLEEQGGSAWQVFWKNVFAIKRRYALNLFEHPSLPGGSLLGLRAGYFPMFNLERIPADINDTFVLINSFFPNVSFVHGASYYQGLSVSPVEEFMRRSRVTRGARIADELFPFPFIRQVTKISEARRTNIGAVPKYGAGNLAFFAVSILFERAFKSLYPYFGSETRKSKWDMAYGSRRKISIDLWRELYASRPFIPPLPSEIELESEPLSSGPYQIYPEE